MTKGKMHYARAARMNKALLSFLFFLTTTGGAFALPGKTEAAAAPEAAAAADTTAIADKKLELHANNELDLTYNMIGGQGASQSSLQKGWVYSDALNLSGNGAFKGYEYRMNLGVRYTNDQQLDVKKVLLTNLQGRISDGNNTLNVGDTFESFSQYSLNSALKGASYKYYDSQKESPELTLVYGLAYPRWDNFYGDSEVKALKRTAAGARLKQTLSPDFWLGMSALNVTDDAHSRIFDTDPVYENSVYSMDFEYRPAAGLTVRNETAAGFASLTPQKGAAAAKADGSAQQTELIMEQGKNRVNLEYERVSPYFLTLLGSASTDREKLKGKWKYKYDRDISFNFAMLWFRDDLNRQKAYQSSSYKPEIGVTLAKLFNRQYGTADLDYKYDRVYGGGASTVNHLINANYRDRFFGLDSDTNAGYSIYKTNAKVRDEQELLVNTSLRDRRTMGKFVFKPALYLGVWTDKNELSNSRDKIYEYSVALDPEIPSQKITSTFKAGQKRLLKAGADDLTRTFLNCNIFYKAPFLNKLFANLNQGVLYFKARVNDLSYTTAAKSFTETSLSTGVNVEF